MTTKDFKFYCNRIINEWIVALLLNGLQIILYILFAGGLLGGGVILLLISEELLTFKFYIPFFICLILICLIVFIILIQFELRVLIDLKIFVRTPNNFIGMIENNTIKDITNELEFVCRYLVKSTDRNIPELSNYITRFKNMKYKKEGH